MQPIAPVKCKFVLRSTRAWCDKHSLQIKQDDLFHYLLAELPRARCFTSLSCSYFTCRMKAPKPSRHLIRNSYHSVLTMGLIQG